MVPCGAHDEELLAHEREVLFCSTVAACDRCEGTLLEDCARCEDGPDHALADARRKAIQAWVEASDAVETHMGRPLPRIETAAFRLVIETGELREGRKKVDQHLLAHRIAQDVEVVKSGLYADFSLEPDDVKSKMRLWIWSNLEDHLSAMRQFLATASSGDFKMLGKAPVFSVWTEPSLFDTVPAVRTLFAHNAAHMLLSNALFPLWTGDLGGGWLDAGVGHHYEYLRFGATRNYCIEEATASGNYEDGVWRAAIAKRLKREEEPFLPGLMTRNTGAMEQDQQALCWSFFEYLVHEHQPALRDILADLKAKKKPREILPDRIGMSVLAADAAWRAWVAEAYPKRGDALRLPKDDKAPR